METSHIYYDGHNAQIHTYAGNQEVTYCISNGVMMAFFGKYKCRVTLKRGCIYDIVINKSGLPEIKQGLPPQDPADVITWLLGFSNSKRFRHRDAFAARLQDILINSQHLHAHHIVGRGYEFLFQRHPATSELYPALAYLDANRHPDIALVKEILQTVTRYNASLQFGMLPYSEAYFKRILRQYFNLTDADWQEIQSICANLFPPPAP